MVFVHIDLHLFQGCSGSLNRGNIELLAAFVYGKFFQMRYINAPIISELLQLPLGISIIINDILVKTNMIGVHR